MKKVLVISIVLFCLILVGMDNAKAVTMSALIEQLKMKLAEDQLDFPDSILGNLISLSYGIVIPHGLAYKVLETVYAQPGQARVDLSTHCGLALFVSSVRIGGYEGMRSLIEIQPKDLARRYIKTYASSPQFFVFYRDIITGTQCGLIYVYPTPTALETLQIIYYLGTADDANPDINVAYEDVIVDFALFFAYIRKKQWQDVALVYNEASQQLTKLRELFVNRKPDITVAPKEIE